MKAKNATPAVAYRGAVSGATCDLGAVQLMPPGVDPCGWNRVDAKRLTNADVEMIVGSVTWDAPMLRCRDIGFAAVGPASVRC